MLGADWTRSSWTVGLLVSHARGEGSYQGADRGRVETELTGFYPYGRYALNGRVTLWGVAGFGTGTLTLTPDGRDAMETDLDLAMAAAGLRRVVVPAPAGGGLELAAVTDTIGVRTTSAEVIGGADAGDIPSASRSSRSVSLGWIGSCVMACPPLSDNRRFPPRSGRGGPRAIRSRSATGR